MRELIGTTLGKYSIVALLGRGGMANVYQAHQPRLDRYVAIKVLHSHLADDADLVWRFEREATAVASLSHPGIVKIYDFDADDGLYYMVMGLIDGPTLKAEMRARREHQQPFTLSEIGQIIAPLTAAVGHAHAKGMVHRDIKPANVMLTGAGQVVITDFGLAHILGGARLTRPYATSGTPEYMSPEQAQGEHGDERSDIYSLGVVLYEMVTGRLPFEADTAVAIIMGHMMTEPTPPRELSPDLPQAVEKVVLRALRKDPADRFQSMEEMSLATRAALGQADTLDAPLTVLAPAPQADTISDSRLRGTDFRKTRPYRGLLAFREKDAPFFFGRDALTEHLVDTVREQAMVAVVGPSGSGKSSVVFAGLIPRLRQQANWTVVHFRPGSRPFEALANAFVPLLEPDRDKGNHLDATQELAQALSDGTLSLRDVVARVRQKRGSSPPADDGSIPSASHDSHRLLLVADQFEELYTLCADPETRQRFTAILLDAIGRDNESGTPFVLVLTLRADFMGQALTDRSFADALQTADVKLGPMTREELSQAIEQPAAKLGVSFESGLVERILNDVGNEPGNLPLLEFALALLWDRRAGRRLTHAAYEAISRVEGSLARYADKVYARLSEDEKSRAPRVFTQMVRPGEGTEDTRRLATRSELGEQDWALTQRLADERLVVTGQDPLGQGTAEVIHEALIHGWRRLQEWMNAERSFRSWQERLRAGLSQWQSHGQDEALLLRGSVLAEAENWRAARGKELGQDELAFIEASVAERQARQAEEAARQRRELETAQKLAETEKARAETERQRAEEQSRAAHRLRRRAVLLTGALVIAAALAFVALWFGREATLNANRAQAEANSRATAEALAVQERQTAQAEAYNRATAEAIAVQERQEAEDQRQIAEEQRQEAEDQRRIALSRQLAAQSTTLLDSQLDLALLLSLEANNLFDTAETRGSLLAALQHNPRLVTFLQGHPYLMWVTFSPDGKLLASVGGNGSVRLWTVDYPQGGPATVRPLGEPLVGHDEGELVNSAAFSPDGTLLATACDDHTVNLWDTSTGELLRTLSGHTAYVQSVAFSPDGQTIASAGGERTIRLWDVATGQPTGTLTGPAMEMWQVAFSPDGQTLAAINSDATISLWDMNTNQPRGEPLKGHPFRVLSIAFSPDGQTLASVDTNEPLVRLWDVATASPAGEIDTGFTVMLVSVAFSPDGQWLALRTYDGLISFWDLASGERLGETFAGNTGDVTNIAFSPDGRLLASGDDLGTILVWDATGELQFGQPLLYNPAQRASQVSFSPDGRTVAVGSPAGTITLYDANSGTPIGAPMVHASLEPVGISGVALTAAALGGAEGQKLYTSHTDGTLALWNPAEGSLERGLTTYHVYGDTILTLSPDETWMAAGGSHGHITLWDAASGYAFLFLSGHQGKINGLAFNSEGSILASGSSDGTVRLWHISGYTSGPLSGLPAQESGVRSVAISPAVPGGLDSQVLAAGGDDGSIILWSLADEERLTQIDQAHTTAVLALAFDEQALLSVGQDGQVMRWDLPADPQELAVGPPAGRPLLDPAAGTVTCATLDGPFLALGYADGTVQVWKLGPDEPTGEMLLDTSPTGSSAITSLTLAESQIVAGSADGTIHLWDLSSSSWPPSWSLDRPIAVSPTEIDYSSDGSTIVSAAYNGTIILWDAATGQPRQQLFGHSSAVFHLAFNPAGSMLATGGCNHFSVEASCDQGEIILWDVDSGQILDKLVGHVSFVYSVAFSPDGSILASGSCGSRVVGGTCMQGETILWDVATGEPIGQPLTAHADRVHSVAFSPDGRLLASGSRDSSIVLWDVATGQQVGQRLVGHTDEVRRVLFSHDGTMLISGGYGEMQDYRYVQGEIFLWDVASGRQIGHPFIVYPGVVSDLALAPATAGDPQGQWLASASSGGRIALWDISADSWRRRACRIANRNLTTEEWTQFFGSDPYRETCAGLPVPER